MGIVFRQSAKTSIVVLTGAVLGALILWLSTRYVPKHEYGFTQDFAYKALTLSQLLLMGLNNTMVVYTHKFAGEPRKRALLLGYTFTIPLLLTFIFTIIYYLLRTGVLNFFQPEDVALMQRYFKWLPVYTLLFMYQTMLEQYLGARMKVAISAFLREIVLRLVNIALILLFGFGYISFTVFVIGTILIYAVLVGIYFLLSMKTEGFAFSFQRSRFTTAEYKEITHFTWYHFLLSASIILMSYMDMLLISHYDRSGFDSAAVYRVAIFFIAILYLPLKALSPASATVLMQALAEEDYPKARDIFSRASINILIPSVCLAVMLTCNLNNAVAVINKGYDGIAVVFLILLVGALFNIATGMNDLILTFTNYYKFNFYLSLVLIIVLFFLLKFLIPIYGIYGAAVSSTSTYVVFNFIKYLFIRKKLGMEPFSRKTLLVLVAGLPALAVGYFFPYLFEPGRHIYVHTFMDAAMRSTLIVIVFMLMLYWLKPSPDLSEYIASIKKNKRLF